MSSSTISRADVALRDGSGTSHSSADSARWNQFVADSPYGDVLQCLEWGEVKRPEWYPVPISIESGGQLNATALVLRRDIPSTRRTYFYVSRGPILDWSKPDIATALIERLKAEAEPHRAAFIKIDPAVPVGTPGTEETIRRLGFVPSPDAQNSFGGTQPRYVMKLDISASEDKVMAGFHQKWRYNTRLAERKGVTVKSDCSRDDLKIFHDLYKVTAQRDGFVGYPLSYFQKLWDALVTKDMARLFITYYQGQPLSAAISFVLPPQCWYVFGASSNEHRNVMPNYLMQWAMMQWAKERGCTTYDFRGVHDVSKTTPQASTDGETDTKENAEANSLINSPDGLVRFKAGFGAQLVEYIGEWDLPLNKYGYWFWTTARPKLSAAVRSMKKRR
ncbi:MAG: peptidoglycan bridge formation glycyltransferase FemA/FemB family protein [Abitibacteriaceae bacterium]|nr:peptidoglycan bridge formation glycyltransferase FemA/FemB family protein [Abditibacteriaceae bacterium]